MNSNQRQPLTSPRPAEEWSAGLRPGAFENPIPSRRVGDRRSYQIKDAHEN